MIKDKELDYPVELESQIIMRLPEEPAKALRNVLNTGENLKNRLTFQMETDMRRGEIRFDHWLLHAKIVDLPTIVESHKTIDRKSIYKTADICQMMICKDEIDPASTEDESPTKNKKKDPLKVDKKYLWPHGITPPTKNVRKRRFRKTLKKKNVEAPEIEKEVKRLLRADSEAVSFTWEVINEEDERREKHDFQSNVKPDKTKTRKDRGIKSDLNITNKSSSKVEDIFGGALSDSDLEDENINVDIEDSRISAYDDPASDSLQGTDIKTTSRIATQFSSSMFGSPDNLPATSSTSHTVLSENRNQFSIDDYFHGHIDNRLKLQQISQELEELKQRRQRTQFEITEMENVALRHRFEEVLRNLNKEILSKEKEFQNLQSCNK